MSDLPEKPSNWQQLTDKIFGEMQQWRSQHPHATFDQIEQAIDQHLAQLRSQMLADSAQDKTGTAEQPLKSIKCQKCGVKLHQRGKHTRYLITEDRQSIRLERHYLVCPKCGVGLFPPR